METPHTSYQPPSHTLLTVNVATTPPLPGILLFLPSHSSDLTLFMSFASYPSLSELYHVHLCSSVCDPVQVRDYFMPWMVSDHTTSTEASLMAGVSLREWQVGSQSTGTYMTRTAKAIPKENFPERLVIQHVHFEEQQLLKCISTILLKK